jgi:hypothetical protein
MTVDDEVSLATTDEGIWAEFDALHVAWDGGVLIGMGLPPEVWLGTIVVAGVDVIGGVGEVCSDIEPPAGTSTDVSL